MGYRVIRERRRVWGVGWNAYAAKARDAETNLKGGAIPFFRRMFACDIANCLTCNCIFSFMNGHVFYLVESYFWTSGYLSTVAKYFGARDRNRETVKGHFCV